MPASIAEWLAVLLALAYVLLATRQSRWCWPAAAVSSAIYLVLFARGGLPMQAALQGFYVAMAGYGWIAWRAGHGEPDELPIRRWSAPRHLLAFGVIVLLTVLNVRLLPGPADSLVPYGDAFVAWGSVLATWMVARKVLENWLYWIVFDLAGAALYFAQGFRATAALFLVFVVLAIRGYLQWRADSANAAAQPAPIGGG